MADQASEVTSDVPVTQSTGSAPGSSLVDSTPVTITNQKLHGNNFLAWSRAVELFVTGRGKKEFLSEKMVIPSESDAKFTTWEAENSMIMSWLLGSMTPEVRLCCILLQLLFGRPRRKCTQKGTTSLSCTSWRHD